MVKKVIAKKLDAVKAIKGLLTIAKLAMPDTYFQTDARVNYAKEFLKQQQTKKKRNETISK